MSISTSEPLREAVTVAEMARMLSMSRARFYQLQRDGYFPLPVFSVTSRRPLYTAELQQVCLDVRRRNCGINGIPICFYARRAPLVSAPAPRRPVTINHAPRPRPTNDHSDLLAALEALGMTPTASQVSEALRATFPSGTAGADEGSLVRAVYQQLRRQNPSDNHRR
jgi:hypothetical protein